MALETTEIQVTISQADTCAVMWVRGGSIMQGTNPAPRYPVVAAARFDPLKDY